MSESDLPYAILIALILLLVFSGLCGIYTVEKNQCHFTGEKLGVTSEWHPWFHCYLELDDGRMVPEDRWFYIMGEVE